MEIFAIVPFFAARPILAVAVLLLLAVLRCSSVGDACQNDPIVALLLIVPAAFAEALAHYVVAWFRRVADDLNTLYDRLLVALQILFGVLCVVAWLVTVIFPAVAASSEAEPHSSKVALVFAAVAIIVVSTIVRSTVMGAVRAINPGDVLGLRGPLAVLETAGTIVGVVVAAMWPIVGAILALLVLGVAVAGVIIIRRAIGSTPCTNCGRSMHPSALACARCDHPLASPKKIGMLGRARNVVVDDVNVHRASLVLAGRCAKCAEQIQAIDKACSACGSAISVTRDDLARHAKHESRKALALAFVSALIPVVGLPLAFVVVRLSPADGVRRYLPITTRVIVRGVLNVAVLAALLLLQPIPVVGAAIVTAFLGARLAMERMRFAASR